MQRSPTKLGNGSPEQMTLLPERRPSKPVGFEIIRTLKDTADALDYACELAGLRKKEIYLQMGIDKGVWSRICSGEFDLDGRDVPRFNKVVGNSAYLQYLIHVDGWDLNTLHKAQDDKDRRIAELENELADQRRASRLLVGLMRSGGGT